MTHEDVSVPLPAFCTSLFFLLLCVRVCCEMEEWARIFLVSGVRASPLLYICSMQPLIRGWDMMHTYPMELFSTGEENMVRLDIHGI